MDGETHGTYATEEDAATSIAWENHRFAQSPRSLGGAYLPRSICHIPCGIVRRGQYSTSYYSPDCSHRAETADVE